MFWWVVSLTLLVASIATKDMSVMTISGIFAIAGAITYVGVVIKDTFKNSSSKEEDEQC